MCTGAVLLTMGFLSFPFPFQKWNVSQTKIRIISTIIFILFGCVLFVALPAVIFKHIEGWNTLDAIYFVVITLTTIGFGDYVAGKIFSHNSLSYNALHRDIYPAFFSRLWDRCISLVVPLSQFYPSSFMWQGLSSFWLMWPCRDRRWNSEIHRACLCLLFFFLFLYYQKIK